MPPETANPASAGARTGSGNDVAIISASIVIAVERANNSSAPKKHGPPPRHGSGPRRFEISSQLIADAEQPKSRA
jgi:hypothetical protein